jgi:hypothetical protein
MKTTSHCIAFVVTAALLLGCQSTYRAAQLDALPKSRGSYTGSLTVDPWTYLCSDGEYHYLVYRWTIDNTPHCESVKIPREEIVMEGDRIQSAEGPVAVSPIRNASGAVTGFTADKKR